MVDPDTGESLGSELEKVGTARVIKVSPKYSIAETKAKGVTKSDILQTKQTPPGKKARRSPAGLFYLNRLV